MTETVRLVTDGPHDDEYTCEVAAALSEAVRVLNHATLSHAGVSYPATVNDVLGKVSVAAARLDQLLRQLGEALQRMQASGQLGDDCGDPAGRLDKALSELTLTQEMARDLAMHIDCAFNTTATLHLTGAGES